MQDTPPCRCPQRRIRLRGSGVFLSFTAIVSGKHTARDHPFLLCRRKAGCTLYPLPEPAIRRPVKSGPAMGQPAALRRHMPSFFILFYQHLVFSYMIYWPYLLFLFLFCRFSLLVMTDLCFDGKMNEIQPGSPGGMRRRE